MSTVPKERRISAAILGTEPRKLPFPRLPGSSPRPLLLHLRRRNRGVQNRPGSGLGAHATGTQRRAGGPTGRGRERAGGDHHSLSFRPASGSSPKFAKAQPQPPKSLRSLAEVAWSWSHARPDTCRYLRSISKASHQVLLGRTRERECVTPRRTAVASEPQQHPHTCGGGEHGLTWALEEEATEAGGWRGQPPAGAAR